MYLEQHAFLHQNIDNTRESCAYSNHHVQQFLEIYSIEEFNEAKWRACQEEEAKEQVNITGYATIYSPILELVNESMYWQINRRLPISRLIHQLIVRFFFTS